MDIWLTSLIFKSKRVLIVCFTAVSPIGTEIFKASLGIFFGIKLRNACNNLSSPKTIAVFFLVISIVDNALPISLAWAKKPSASTILIVFWVLKLSLVHLNLFLEKKRHSFLYFFIKCDALWFLVLKNSESISQ